ncbi:formate dehydrogenase-O major subunit [Photobacterium aphoticum]|uniref:Formate dehydrogenase-O major subunit n=1 Tax=Photobacterium aphoticum TaxID=754436 RepID=A0A090QL50_9GAMM|nr:formate dehydrogenase-O major subunit [Photobacterium aphoticum]
MKLTKRSDNVSKDENQLGITRRSFIRNTSLAAAGGVAGASLFAPGMMKKPMQHLRMCMTRQKK